MLIKTSATSYRKIQDNVFFTLFGIISNGRVYNTQRYYNIIGYEYGTIIKHIKRCI